MDYLKITSSRTGPHGKTKWLLWKGVRVLFDDNWSIVKEAQFTAPCGYLDMAKRFADQGSCSFFDLMQWCSGALAAGRLADQRHDGSEFQDWRR